MVKGWVKEVVDLFAKRCRWCPVVPAWCPVVLFYGDFSVGFDDFLLEFDGFLICCGVLIRVL
ncbi:hypothetical protein Hanom_Chr01g00008951 [Helianthus anomalus]